MPPDPPNVVIAAQHLAALGWPVMPVKPRSKEPLTAHGVKDATTTERTILHWFERWPEANLAIATGLPGPQVLDVDDPASAGPMLGKLKAIHPPTVATVRGPHLYFAGTDRGTISLGFGELRGKGSYVLVPPSIHPSGKEYVWLDPPTKQLPALPDLLAGQRTTAGTGDYEAKPLILHGERHDALKDAAVRFLRGGFTDPVVLEQMIESFFRMSCHPDPPPRKNEFRDIARWATNTDIAERERERESAPTITTTGSSARPSSGWPRLPGHDAGLTEIRAYLNQAAVLPPHWNIDLVERHGLYPTDPMTVTIRTPGPLNEIHVRFEHQREASKPAALRGAFMEATRGNTRMRYPKTAQASDFYAMLCALAHIGSQATVADETRAWLTEYLQAGTVLEDLSLTPEKRYDALLEIQERQEFTRVQANQFVRDDLDPEKRWAIIVDSETEELWVRAGELAAYLRHVYGVGSVAQHTLDARVAEVGGERMHLDEDRRHKDGRHVSLVFYRFPSAQAFPSVSRIPPSEETS